MTVSPSRLFASLTTGVYVVAAAHEGRASAFTAAWLTQVSFDPLLLALSINRDGFTWSLLRESRVFAVHVLGRDQVALARHFGTHSTRDVNKLDTSAFDGLHWHPGPDGTPHLDDVLARFDCHLEREIDAGDHALVIARVTGGEMPTATAEPLRYADTGNIDGAAGLYPDRFA